jgi:hypothetical protein
MNSLSPAAQAVLDAMHRSYDHEPTRRAIAAELLRALADQVVPEQSEPPCGGTEPWPHSYQLMSDSKWEQRHQTRAELLAIAAELEGKSCSL